MKKRRRKNGKRQKYIKKKESQKKDRREKEDNSVVSIFSREGEGGSIVEISGLTGVTVWGGLRGEVGDGNSKS